jgi:hypothetical protein
MKKITRPISDGTTADRNKGSGTSHCSVVSCPSCGSEIKLGFRATVPDSQKITITLKRSEGDHFAAECVAGVIDSQVRILQSVAEGLGSKVAVFVSNIQTRPAELEIEFTVIATKKP